MSAVGGAGRAPDVLVGGAGVIGASVAWHLAARGVTGVAVLDAGAAPGAGSTARATGGYRGQFSTAVNVRLSLESRRKLLRFRDEVGTDPQYRQVGYLFLCDGPAHLDAFREARAVQHACGLHEAVEIGVAEAAALAPHARLDGVAGAAWCPTDGTIRPMEILRGYLAGVERAGVPVHWGARVTGVERDAGGRIVAVESTAGRFTPGQVVNAAGAWAGGVAALAGVDLPVRPARRQIAVAVGHGLPDDVPMTIWARDAFHLRVRDGQALLNWPVDTPAGHPFSLDLHRPWVEATWAMARERVPAMSHARLDDTAHWVGLYELSPDKTVILGHDPACPNLLLVNGSSGHGVMHSPALGHLAAELLVDGHATLLDVRPLRPTRFAEGDAHPVNDLL